MYGIQSTMNLLSSFVTLNQVHYGHKFTLQNTNRLGKPLKLIYLPQNPFIQGYEKGDSASMEFGQLSFRYKSVTKHSNVHLLALIPKSKYAEFIAILSWTPAPGTGLSRTVWKVTDGFMFPLLSVLAPPVTLVTDSISTFVAIIIKQNQFRKQTTPTTNKYFKFHL